MNAQPSMPKEVLTRLAQRALKTFLDTGCTLDCRPRAFPRASIVIPVCNRADLTLMCLQSLALRQNQTPFEIIIVDNGSTDETERLLPHVQGLRVVRNATNAGFPKAVNQAAQLAAGTYLIMLNNDVQVLGNSIDGAVEFLDANPDAGAVGGKIILLDGTLQEAGNTIGRDAWPYQYGRGQSPDAPAFAFQRDVDYCSAAFLATPRELFHALAGLDEVFSPGYFEECDYCARLYQAGRRVVYLPEIGILHFENATSLSVCNVPDVTCRNHSIFARKQADWLRTRPSPSWSPVTRRTSEPARFNVLVLDRCVSQDAPAVPGLYEIAQLVQQIALLDGFATACLIDYPSPTRDAILRCLPRTVEILHLDRAEQVQELVTARAAYYDLVLVRDPTMIDCYALPGYSRTRSAILREGRLEMINSHPSDPDHVSMAA
jgi:GT2 family glycosyltransferase